MENKPASSGLAPVPQQDMIDAICEYAVAKQIFDEYRLDEDAGWRDRHQRLVGCEQWLIELAKKTSASSPAGHQEQNEVARARPAEQVDRSPDVSRAPAIRTAADEVRYPVRSEPTKSPAGLHTLIAQWRELAALRCRQGEAEEALAIEQCIRELEARLAASDKEPT